MIITYNAPSQNIPTRFHFFFVLRLRLLIIGRGIQRTVISSTMSVTVEAMYIAPSFMIMVPIPVQLVEIGHAWNRVVRKNAVSHARITTIRTFATRLKVGVANICL